MADYRNIILLVVFCIFATATAIQLFYYLFFYLAVYFKKFAESSEAVIPVSVIICARNEAENLENFLPSVLKQDYPDFEVIVVNDCSEDNSYDILGKFLKDYPHLKISTVNKDPKFTHNKKFAQFIGIKAAKNEILLFTDADCQPESDKWLQGMASDLKKKLILYLDMGLPEREGTSKQVYQVRLHDNRYAISRDGYSWSSIHGGWEKSGLPSFSIL